MLEKLQQAPGFSAINQDGKSVSLSDYAGRKNVVLYFYPKDDTPGCTIEANQFTALADEFTALDTVVLGVSRDSCDSHRAFIGKYGLNVELLADSGGELCQRYGVWQEKEKNGVKRMGIVRSTFVINKVGVLEEALYGVSADGHAQAMLERVRAL
jgi:peroxiredoxin